MNRSGFSGGYAAHFVKLLYLCVVCFEYRELLLKARAPKTPYTTLPLAEEMNPSVAHAELIATFRRAQADAEHKLGLIKAVEKKGPKAMEAAVETAAKAAKRRDSYAKKLAVLGVSLKD